MKKFLFITMMMILSIGAIAFASTPCCNNKMDHCTKCAKTCTGPNCMDHCSKACKSAGECDKICK